MKILPHRQRKKRFKDYEEESTVPSLGVKFTCLTCKYNVIEILTFQARELCVIALSYCEISKASENRKPSNILRVFLKFNNSSYFKYLQYSMPFKY